MAVRQVAGDGVEKRRRDNVPAVEHDEPVHRGARIRRCPSPQRMRLRDRQPIERALHDPRQQRHGIDAGLRADKEEKRALGFLEPLQRLDGVAAALQRMRAQRA
jgi:hypothetical protein